MSWEIILKELKNEFQLLLENGVTTKMSFPIDDDMIGTGTSAKSYNQRQITPQIITNDGIDFRDIPIKNPDTNEVIARYLN